MKKLPKNKKIIVFDGECLLCNNYVKFIAKHDSKDYFRFISIQNNNILKQITAKKNITINNKSIFLINNDDSVKTKSAAIIYILSQLRFPYKLLMIINILPKGLLDYFYDFIARKRHVIFGKVDYCSAIYSSKIKNIKQKIIE
tara:strand:+ start:610 stop:1038 length:429 start_codon:yes stop_codon:yes gene_type:complete